MAVITHTKPRYHGMKVTREEYLDLEDDGFKYDMIDGVLYMSPSPFAKHNEVLTQILRVTANFLYEKNIGKVLPETDVYLPDGGDVLRPDITVILKENYGIIKGHIHGVPDIVIEVLSDSSIKRDLGVKADRYLKNGIKEYWIADPDDRTIQIWQNQDQKSWLKKEGDSVESSVLPGFVFEREKVFVE